MKLTLRATLTTILLSLLILTFAAIGFNGYRNVRFIAEDLSDQILKQTAQLIDVQINDMLHTANEQGKLNRRMFLSGQQKVDAFPTLARYWVEVMRVHTQLTRLSLGLEATGEWLYVNRLDDLGGGRRTADARGATHHQRAPQVPRDRPARPVGVPARGYPDRPIFFDRDMDDRDPRPRPWYAAAKAAGKQTWSDTYVFFGSRGEANVPGITCATPIYDPGGSLVGVVSGSFDVVKLSLFLRTLKVGDHGYAFVVEYRGDGSRRVIAHHDPSKLTRPTPGNPRGRPAS